MDASNELNVSSDMPSTSGEACYNEQLIVWHEQLHTSSINA